MRILVINPNSTEAMTRSIERAARQAAGPQTEIVAVNPIDGPPSIQGPEDGAAALPGLFALFDREIVAGNGFDAVIIACFDDTGLPDLKSRTPMPVLGIGEAAFHVGMLCGSRFSVVTTLAVSVPVIEENLARYGFAGRCVKVRASDVPVLDLERPGSDARSQIAAEIGASVRDDKPASVILGCAGMARLADELSAEFGLPVIDGVRAAVGLAEVARRSGAGRAFRT